MQQQLLVHIFTMIALHGIQEAIKIVNQVLIDHNESVEQKPNRNMLYWLDTSSYSDEQCLLSSMLNKSLCYSLVQLPQITPKVGELCCIHNMWGDGAYCHYHKHGEAYDEKI